MVNGNSCLTFTHSYTDGGVNHAVAKVTTNTSGAVRVRVVSCSETPRHLARRSPGIEPAKPAKMLKAVGESK